MINVESADSEFASAYLSFTSDILEQNEIPDYLVRIVQPRLSAVAGVQRADNGKNRQGDSVKPSETQFSGGQGS